MATGIIERFDQHRGVGIIRPDLPGDNLYAEASQLTMGACKQLIPGQRVSYVKAMNADGLQARDIRLLPALPDAPRT